MIKISVNIGTVVSLVPALVVGIKLGPVNLVEDWIKLGGTSGKFGIFGFGRLGGLVMVQSDKSVMCVYGVQE